MIAFLAFVAGYRKTTITESIDDFFSWFEESEEQTAKPAATPSPAPDKAVEARTLTPGNRGPAANPYSALLKNQQQPTQAAESGGYWMKAKKNPFGGTLDAIQQKKIQDHQTQQRNLYFEKLSEQMKAMRGENPTAPAARRGVVDLQENEGAEPMEHEAANTAETEPPPPDVQEPEFIDEEPQTVVFDPEGELQAQEEQMAAEEEALLDILSEMGQ